MSILSWPEGWDVLGVPRVGCSHGQDIPGSFPFLSSEKCLQDSSEVEGVKNSRFWVWLDFKFPFVVFRSPVCNELSSAAAFKMMKMQMPDLRYCNEVSIYNRVCHWNYHVIFLNKGG